MIKNLDLIEEMEYLEKFSSPFLSYVGDSIIDRKRVARDVLMRKVEDILLIEKWGFGLDCIFAGLSEEQIVFFAKNAPLEYKKELISIFDDREMMNGAWEIVRAMDEDEDNGSTKNANRVKNVIQYIHDNMSAFQF